MLNNNAFFFKFFIIFFYLTGDILLKLLGLFHLSYTLWIIENFCKLNMCWVHIYEKKIGLFKPTVFYNYTVKLHELYNQTYQNVLETGT